MAKSAGMLSAVLLAAVPAAAQAPELAMLGSLEKGGWSLRVRDDGSTQQICLRNGQELIQLQHRQPGCNRFVVEDGADHVVVQYTCRGSGYGRTTIRRESPRLVQIQTTGIANGTPFSLNGEARFQGRC
ncbi:hypothetical protein ACFOWT_16400 [Croceibacterium xixiisoli]|nr:hypothetical protein [Croceibacterium xixiisoli]